MFTIRPLREYLDILEALVILAFPYKPLQIIIFYVIKIRIGHVALMTDEVPVAILFSWVLTLSLGLIQSRKWPLDQAQSLSIEHWVTVQVN